MSKKMETLRRKLRLDKVNPITRKIIIGILGGICLGAGLMMIFLPGPAFVFIPLGLFLLASEFKWAGAWARKVLDALQQMRSKWRLWRRRRTRAASEKV